MKSTGYLIQATLICLWWLGLGVSEKFFDAFQFPSIGRVAFQSFLLPDIAVVALLSTIRAYKESKELEYIILGGFAFASFYCINAMILTSGGYLPSTLMILGFCFNLFLVFQSRVFRTSSTGNIFINSFKTLIQITCVWAITLVVFPSLILRAFSNPIIIEWNRTTQLGIALLVLFSILGIFSAIFMVWKGKGTPLPVDQTNELVTSGPYGYVRNPMAVAGVGQGISISIVFLSLPLAFYSILGGMLWHFVVRPIEEKDMIQRFGDEYSQYQKNVRCWIPRLKPNTKKDFTMR